MAETDHEPEPQTPVTRAGEYLLGTLDDDERERFEQELANEPGVRRELEYWERRLGALGLSLAPVQPPVHVWDRVSARAFGSSVTPIASASSAEKSQPSRPNGPGLWRGLAIAASVAALIMAALLFIGSAPEDGYGNSAPAFASMVYDAPTGTSWLVTAGSNDDAMSVTALSGYDVPKGKVLRAWLVPTQGKPVPVGEWPHTPGVHKLPVSSVAVEYMKKRASLMVSMEDVSPSGYASPAGQLMWTAPIARRTS